MFQKQYANNRLKEFIKKRLNNSDAYIEATAWASFAGTHGIQEISNTIATIRAEKRGRGL